MSASAVSPTTRGKGRLRSIAKRQTNLAGELGTEDSTCQAELLKVNSVKAQGLSTGTTATGLGFPACYFLNSLMYQLVIHSGEINLG